MHHESRVGLFIYNEYIARSSSVSEDSDEFGGRQWATDGKASILSGTAAAWESGERALVVMLRWKAWRSLADSVESLGGGCEQMRENELSEGGGHHRLHRRESQFGSALAAGEFL